MEMVIEFAARDIDMIVCENYNIAGLRDKSRPAFGNRFFRFSPTCRAQKGRNHQFARSVPCFPYGNRKLRDGLGTGQAPAR